MPPTGAHDLDLQALGVSYTCDLVRLPGELRARFVELRPDDATRAYLASADDRRLGRCRTLLQRLLRLYVSDFDANGLLGAYPMYLLSSEQWLRLLGARPGGRLLDVGAGGGDVSLELRPLFDELAATETSRPQARRLRQRGVSCHEIDASEEAIPGAPYDTIACLNVLDRCMRPLTLLDRLVAGIRPGGTLLLALALPYAPAAHVGPYVVAPEERLPCAADAWETAVVELVERCLVPRGLRVERLARAPYFAGGDSTKRMQTFDDVVLSAKRA